MSRSLFLLFRTQEQLALYERAIRSFKECIANFFSLNHTSWRERNVCAFLIHRSARSFKKGNENESLFKKSENIRSRCSLQKERKDLFCQTTIRTKNQRANSQP